MDRTGWKGRNGWTGFDEQVRLDRTGKIGLEGQDRKDKNGWTEQDGQEMMDRTG